MLGFPIDLLKRLAKPHGGRRRASRHAHDMFFTDDVTYPSPDLSGRDDPLIRGATRVATGQEPVPDSSLHPVDNVVCFA